MRVFLVIALICYIGKVSSDGETEVEFDNGIMEELEITTEIVGEGKKPITYKDNAEQMEKLRKKLFSNYDKLTIPNNLTVKFGIGVVNVDIDPVKHTVEAHLWYRYIWKDSRLAYDTEESEVSLLHSQISQVWKPDITLYNSRMTDKTTEENCRETEILIYPNGNVLWVPPCQVSAMCDLKFTRGNELAPVQSCFLKFGSWTYDGNVMNVEFYNKKNYFDTSDMWNISDWRIVSNAAEKNIKYYSCCTEPYITLNYNFTLTKEPNTCN